MALPQKLPLELMQTVWASELNPVIAFPPNNGILLKNIALSIGTNVINHRLSRMQQGWVLTDQDAAASIYRSQPLNKLTLTLTSDAACSISLWVY